MAFSAATKLPSKKEKERIERVLAAYQDAIGDDDVLSLLDAEVASIMSGSATSTPDGRSGKSKSEASSNYNVDDGNVEEVGRCSNIPWNSINCASYNFLTGLASAMLLPYLSVYYHQLGLDSHEIGVVKSIQPWIAILAIPLWGCLADRLRVTRLLFMFSLIGYLVSNVVLVYTPKVHNIDCQNAISRLCVDPKSTVFYRTKSQEERISERISNFPETLTSPDLSPYKESHNQYTSNLSMICKPSQQYVGYFYDKSDLLRLFLYLIVINLVGEIWHAPSQALGNAAVLNGLGKARRNQYGYYKAAGAVGAAIGVFVSGLVVESSEESYVQCGIELSRANYSVCFIGFGICIILVLPIAWMLGGSENELRQERNKEDKPEQPTREYHLRSVLTALCNVRYGSVFLTVTWLSIAIGVAKSFDMWYIEILGGSHSTMAWTSMLGTLVLLVTFLSLPYLTDRLGYLPFIVLALFVTGIGLGVSAVIQNPWWMILPMCLRGIATATSAQCAGAYLADAVDRNHMATLQTIMAAIIFGVGNGAGSLLGGLLIKIWSPFICYAVFAVISFLCCILLILAHLVIYNVGRGQREMDSFERGFTPK